MTPAEGFPAAPSPYPLHWEADVVLRDGATAHLRPINPDDAANLERFHDAQSAESVYLRFFAPMPHLSPRDVHRFTHVDHTDRVAFVATLGDQIVGVGRYDRLEETTANHGGSDVGSDVGSDGGSDVGSDVGPDGARSRGRDGVAEVAFNISDQHQGRGLSSVLLEHLAAAARENGIRRFEAEVLPRNQKMLAVFRQAGYEVTSRFDDGVVELHFDLDPTERSLAVMEAREHRAEARSMERLLNPRSVAVFGASRRAGTVGHKLLADLLAGDFTGTVHVVHPKADAVLGVPVVRRLDQIGEPVDLALIAVPADGVLDVVRDCAVAGVRGLVVVSSGFAETGPRGLARQRELVRLARANGMRVIGPNSWGMINTDDDVRLNLSLVPELPINGRLGLFSQSGGLSVTVLDAVGRRGLGVSTFVSAGNRADVSGNDCMQYWEEDPRTDAVALYLESVGNPRKFSRIARRLARSKPVIVLKSGSSNFGVPPGHAVRRSTAPKEAFEAMLRQSGCIRVETVGQLLDVAQLVLNQPLPAGPRVAIIGNSAALGALLADACVSWNLTVTHGPVSLHPQAGPEQFRTALRTAFTQPDVDAVVAAFIPPIATDAEQVAQVLSEVSAQYPIPVVACFLGTSGLGDRIPSYSTPEEAVRALAAAQRYAAWRRRDPGRRFEAPDLDLAGAHRIVSDALAAADPRTATAGLDLDHETTVRLLAAFGISVWSARAVHDEQSALAAGAELGYPVVLKATAPHLRHRFDLGGVRLNIDDDAQLLADLRQMRALIGPLTGDNAVVQRMAPPGVACVIRTVEDPLFGPVVSFGLGGDASELLGDVAHRIPPLTDVDIADLVRSVRAAPRLFGHRGAAPADVPALEDLLGRVSWLADELPEVLALELNPVVVAGTGLAVLSAQIRLARPEERSDSVRRELSVS